MRACGLRQHLFKLAVPALYVDVVCCAVALLSVEYGINSMIVQIVQGE